jgi:hypothetical protein
MARCSCRWHGGLAVIDVTDPPAARIIYQINLGGTAGGRRPHCHVGLTGQVVAVDMVSGIELGPVSVGSAVLDVALDVMYVFRRVLRNLGGLSVGGSATPHRVMRVCRTSGCCGRRNRLPCRIEDTIPSAG